MLLGLEPENAWRFWHWVGWLWPLAPSLSVVLVARSKIKHRLAFVVLGTLACYGVQSIVARYMVTVPAPVSEGAAVSEQLAQAMLATLVRTNLLSLVLSVLPIAWLYAILRTRPVSVHANESGT